MATHEALLGWGGVSFFMGARGEGDGRTAPRWEKAGGGSDKETRLAHSKNRPRMHAFHRLRIYHTFFRSFYAAGGCISLCCGWLFYRWGGGSLAPLLYFKLGTTAIVYYMVNRFKHREYYYYHNLGISKRRLWAFYEFCDLLVFVLLLIAADLLPEWDTFWR